MAFAKRTYISGQTIITADNLNAIQDELIRLGVRIQTVSALPENPDPNTLYLIPEGAEP